MKTHNHKRFKPTPIESTPQRCKRFIKMTEENDKDDNEVEDDGIHEENNKENK